MKTNEIKEQLVMAQQQDYLLEIYNFNDDDNFNVGKVIAMDPWFVLVESIDWDGKLNGLILIRISSIHSVKAFTDYLKTVTLKGAVAKEHGYYDIWGVQSWLRQHTYADRRLLNQVLRENFDHHEAVVIGTDRYKAQDEFEGFIHQLNAQSLTLHYFNEHDLSFLWEYDILLAKIDYVRFHGTQAATSSKIIQALFADEEQGEQHGKKGDDKASGRSSRSIHYHRFTNS